MTTQGGTMSLPTKFEDLGVKELRRSAVEDFAVPVEKDDNSKSVIAALVEGGIEWADYVDQHPEVKPEPAVVIEETVTTTINEAALRETELDRGNVLTAESMKPVVAAPVLAAPVVASGTQPWLIKMTRENVRFDVKGYTFTQEHPYALVQPDDVEHLLEREDGFRQAYPSELSDFYAR